MKRHIQTALILIAVVVSLSATIPSNALYGAPLLIATVVRYELNELDEPESDVFNSRERDEPTSELDREITPFSAPSGEKSDDSEETRRLVEQKRVRRVVAINALFLLLLLSIFYFKRRARKARPR